MSSLAFCLVGNAIDISTLSVSAQTVGQAEEQSPEPGTVTVGETAPEEETGTEETGTEEGTGTESETPIKAEDGSTGTLHQDANGDGVCDCGEDCAYKTRYLITTQPQGGKVNALGTVGEGYISELSVGAQAKNGGTLSYQWYTGDTEISGATSSTYSLPRPTSTDTDGEKTSYKCKVTCGDITCFTDTAEVTMHYQVPVKLKEGR